jgi:hypothetical protein
MPDIEVPNPEDVAEAKSSSFTKLVAFTVAMYAVALAICALGGNNTGKDVMLNQMQSSNQWAYYQAKAQRERMYLIESRLLALQIEIDGPGVSSNTRERMEKTLAEFKAEHERYGKEKQEIEDDAKRLEANRDNGLTRDPYFDLGEIMLQIAIVIASVAMLSNSKAAYAFGVVIALVGVAFTANGYFLFDEGKLLQSAPAKSVSLMIHDRTSPL